MKSVPILTVLICMFIAGCATRGVSVKMPVQPGQPAPEAADITRGKLDTWRPTVTVENLQGFDEEMFADLRRNVIDPLARGPYRYAIDSITLAAVPDVVREWTLLIALDNGAAVKVEHFVEWDEMHQSYFRNGLKRTLAGLEQVRRSDGALNRYVAHWTKPPLKKSKREIAIAQATHTNEDAGDRLAD